MRTDREPRRRPDRSFLGATVAFAAAAIVATACGTAPAPGAHSQPTGVALDRTHRVPADSRAGAIAYARDLLARLRLPAGARLLPWPAKPPAGLDPMIPAILTDTVDLKVLYHVSASMPAVSTFFKSHRPAAMTLGANGYSSHFGTVTSLFVDFSPQALKAGIYSAELDTAVKPQPGGGSLLRADAFVAWYPPRSAAEHINPSQYVSVRIAGASGPGRPQPTRTFASARIVTRLAALVNRLNAAPDDISNCPGVLVGSHGYQIVFRPAARSSPTVVVSPTSCMFVEVTVGQHTEPALYPATPLITALSRLLRS
jgi:hypothetical protein